MIAITNNLIDAVRASLQGQAEDGFVPIVGMNRYYWSSKDRMNTDQMKRLFPVTVDGHQVFVYHKF
jgi:hypothetical protein